MHLPRLPAPILEHPVESVIAGLLLVALLFISGGPESANTAGPAASHVVAEKM